MRVAGSDTDLFDDRMTADTAVERRHPGTVALTYPARAVILVGLVTGRLIAARSPVQDERDGRRGLFDDAVDQESLTHVRDNVLLLRDAQDIADIRVKEWFDRSRLNRAAIGPHRDRYGG